MWFVYTNKHQFGSHFLRFSQLLIMGYNGKFEGKIGKLTAMAPD